MKPFFTDQVLFTATEKELQMMRIAVANYAKQLGSADPDCEKALKLWEDITKILENLPF